MDKKFGIIVFVLLALTAWSCKPSVPDYEVGYVTTGNPDNSYLDTCKIYCCGD